MSPKKLRAAPRYIEVTEVQRGPQAARLALVAALAFAAGAGSTWMFLREAPAAAARNAGAPDVSRLSAGQAASTLANWEYDRGNFTAAAQQYERALAAGIDNADIRTDYGNCFRFQGDGARALEQYRNAQRQSPWHQNSLFNQAGLFAEVLHDKPKAIAAGREFLRRFPQSPGAEATRKLVADLEGGKDPAEKKLAEFLTTPSAVRPAPAGQ